LGDRSEILFNLETIQAFASKLQKETLSGQTDLFGALVDAGISQPTIQLQAAPARHTDKERLMWERELLGLYISAHPLDNYDTYFSEQTVPLVEMTAGLDGKKMTIGGIVSSVRTIITKSGTKMAFVKIEDKLSETEVIVFPNLYEQVGSFLQQDAVIRASGKVNARDRDGNLVEDVKLIADEIQLVDDEELRRYESHGQKMAAPKPSRRLPQNRKKTSAETKTTAVKSKQPAVAVSLPKAEIVVQKLYVQVKQPNDQDQLIAIKKACTEHSGLQDMVLVLGDETKSAVKMPFKVDANDNLVGKLVKIVGEDCVVVK
ncbi:hypothetical protein B7Y94_03730, partial [Candidatus Saccharibacteria bacterium 32-49-12]